MKFLLLSLLLQVAVPTAVVKTFEEDKPGAPPQNFTMPGGPQGSGEGWSVRREGAGRVLEHLAGPGAHEGSSFALYGPAQYQDGEFSVRVKAASGSRAVGLVWKYQDALNYYSAQLDLGRQEIAVFRISSGNRIRLEREDDLELDAEAWHVMKVVQDRDSIRVYLGGIRVFSERDRNAKGPGSVGLWSSRDTTAIFDDFRIRPPADDKGREP